MKPAGISTTKPSNPRKLSAQSEFAETFDWSSVKSWSDTVENNQNQNDVPHRALYITTSEKEMLTQNHQKSLPQTDFTIY